MILTFYTRTPQIRDNIVEILRNWLLPWKAMGDVYLHTDLVDQTSYLVLCTSANYRHYIGQGIRWWVILRPYMVKPPKELRDEMLRRATIKK